MKMAPYYLSTTRHRVFQLLSLRTGHGLFKSYLKKISAKDINDSTCNCGYSNQTVEHLLLYCSLYQKERETLIGNIGKKKLRRWDLLQNPRNIEYTKEFLEATGIGTHNWFHSGMKATIDDTPQDPYWQGTTNTGWGNLLEENSVQESEDEE
jgi:hypothetical protein